MPNKVADHRRRVVYIEERDNWDTLVKAGKYNGIAPAQIIRIAVNQICEKLRENPKTRFIQPIFDDPKAPTIEADTSEKKFRVFCPKCKGDHRVPISSVDQVKICKDCGYKFVIQEEASS